MLEIASGFLSLLKRSDPTLHSVDGESHAPNARNFKHDEVLIGRWRGAGDNRVGCNDLNRWRLQFTEFAASAEPRFDSGFEIYLAQIHPHDIFKELDSIKQQLVAQTVHQASDIRIRRRDHTWADVTVCREFSYCQHNGELLQLDISIFANRRFSTRAGNSQNL
jgi:hypothetical protein